MKKQYSRKELIEILNLDGISGLNYSDGEIHTNENEIKKFKNELEEAYMMTLEEYSDTSERLYKFLFK